MLIAFPRWLTQSLSLITSMTVHLFVVMVLGLIFYESDNGRGGILEVAAVFDANDTLVPEFDILTEEPEALLETAAELNEWNAADVDAADMEEAAQELTANLADPFAAKEPSELDPVATEVVQFVSGEAGEVSFPGGELLGGSEMAVAYKDARSDIARAMGKDLKKLQDYKPEYIVVLRGEYDAIENVLRLYGIPHTVTAKAERRDLLRCRVLCINCGAGQVHPMVLKNFVEGGGKVISTDWAVTNVQQAFPSQIARARGMSTNDTVQVEMANLENKLMKGVSGKDGRGSWWLESGSYFVEIRSGSVTPLVTSKELAKKYRTSDVVACLLSSGKGELLQIVSHVFLQDGDRPGLVAMHRLLFNFLLEEEK